jgi:hypothetical protein
MPGALAVLVDPVDVADPVDVEELAPPDAVVGADAVVGGEEDFEELLHADNTRPNDATSIMGKRTCLCTDIALSSFIRRTSHNLDDPEFLRFARIPACRRYQNSHDIRSPPSGPRSDVHWLVISFEMILLMAPSCLSLAISRLLSS